jgi:hypothetical protein
MRRLKGYSRLVAWQTGISYLLLWAVTVWALDDGATVFGKSGVCYPDEAKVLFYWVCEPSSPLAILASVVNLALTATVWAPVYVAAATAQPDALAIAVPIIIWHLVGLPLGIFVLIRMMATALDLRRRVGSGRALPPPAQSAQPPSEGQSKAPAELGVAAAAVVAPPVQPTPPAAVAAAVSVRRIAPPPKPVRKVKPRNEFGLRRPERV